MKSLVIFFLASLFGVNTESIYRFTTLSPDKKAINFNDFRQKKILIVNIATNSEHLHQLTALQQLYEQYQKDLIVIAFPSNSFGHEQRSDDQIEDFCINNFKVSFPVTITGDVEGPNAQPIFNWLTKASQNGALDSKVKDDFQKYLIDKNGELVGVFSGSTLPTAAEIINALESN